jgi:hypothetical protein
VDDSFKSLWKTVVMSVGLSVFSNAVYALLTGSITTFQILLITAISIVSIVLVLPMPFFRKLFITRSGVVDYRSSLSVEQSAAYWKKIKNEFMYVGVTGASIQEPLRKYIQNEIGDRRKYRFLLMKPDGGAFRIQIAFEKGFDIKQLTPEHEQIIASEAAAAHQRLNAFIATIAASRPSRNSPRRAEIRIYDEFTPWWAYMLDDRDIVLGLIISDDGKPGEPVVIFRKNEKAYVNLFSAFKSNIERLWNSGQPVPLDGAKNGI